MAPDAQHDALADELRALGRALPPPAAPPELTDAVMARLADTTPSVSRARQPARNRVADVVTHRGRRRPLLVVATVLLMALLGVPAVRAAVADWFGFAGVRVLLDPTPRSSEAPPPPAATGGTSLDKARELVAFEPVLPAALGAPQRVEVSADRRVLSMSWTDRGAGTIRLDQFDARLDYVFAKTAPGVQYTPVAGSIALWFAEPHEVVVLATDGTRRTETARLAGHTLIWEHGGSALRLEGDVTLERAVEIAESVEPMP